MTEKINAWVIRIFCLLWAVFILLEYVNFSSYYTYAVTYSKYYGLFFLCLGATALGVFLMGKKTKSQWVRKVDRFRPIYLYGMVLSFMLFLMAFYLSKNSITNDVAGSIMSFLFKAIGFHLGLFFIILAAHNSGMFLLNRLKPADDSGRRPFTAIGIGFALIVLLCFLCGAIGFLNAISSGVILILLIGLGWQFTLPLFKDRLLRKMKPFDFHWIAVIPLAVLGLSVAINLTSAIRPLPVGFDALALYMKTPKLIAGYEALTGGGQAYNWSIMMSLGFILFKSTAAAIHISVLPGLLCILVLFRIARHYVSREWAIVAACIFYTFPSILFQSRFDAKVDLAMIFLVLTSILLVLDHYYKQKTEATDSLPWFKRPTVVIWFIVGLLTGFAFGIKYTALFSILVFLVVIFYLEAGKWAATGMFFLTFFIVFGLRLNSFSNLEVQTSSLIWLAGIPLLIGIAALGFSFRSSGTQLKRAATIALIFGATSAMTFTPWAIKHVAEHGSVSIKTLVSGKTPLPKLDFRKPKPTGTLEQPANQPETTNQQLADVGSLRAGLLPELPIADWMQSLIPRQVSLQAATGQVKKERTPEQKAKAEARRKKRQEAKRAERKAQQEAEQARQQQEGSPASAPANQVDPSKKERKEKRKKKEIDNTAKYEEINRYIGYEQGLIRFVSLPYDLTMKQNLKLWATDICFLFLALLPLFMFSFQRGQLPFNILKMLLATILLSFSAVSASAGTGAFNMGQAMADLGNHFAEPSMLVPLFKQLHFALKSALLSIGQLLLPIYELFTMQSLEMSLLLVIFSTVVLYFLYRKVLAPRSQRVKLIVLIVYTTLLLWLLLASGIIWYGAVGFALFPVVLLIFIAGDQDGAPAVEPAIQYGSMFFIGCWLLMTTAFQLVPLQMTMGNTKPQDVNFDKVLEEPFMRYAIDDIKEKDALNYFYSQTFRQILSTLNSRRNKDARILNVYAPLNYHITNSDIRVYEDNQLQTFYTMYRQANEDPGQTIALMKKAGIKYVLISLKTPSVDRTPEKTLTAKFYNLLNTVSLHPGARILYTDHLVERDDGPIEMMFEGRKIRAANDLAGKRAVKQGTIALFEIL